MSLAVQKPSIAARSDEAHVRGKAALPEGGFCLWMRTPIEDAEFVRRLQHEYNVRVLERIMRFARTL